MLADNPEAELHQLSTEQKLPIRVSFDEFQALVSLIRVLKKQFKTMLDKNGPQDEEKNADLRRPSKGKKSIVR